MNLLKHPIPFPIFFLAAVLLAGCGKPGGPGGMPQRGPQPVEVVLVERRDMTQTLRLAGSVEANESVEIRAEVPGIVREIGFEEGQTVEKGQMLFQIDDRELRAQLTQTEAQLGLARQNLDRSRNLSNSKVISQSELDTQQTQFDQAKAELELINVRLEKSTIRAPFAGTMGSRSVSPGDFVGSTTPLSRLDDLSRLKISFSVPERFYPQIKEGGAFAVTAAALDGAGTEPVRGEVYFVSRSVARDTRSAEVKGLVTNPPPGLKPGMFANVELVLAENKDLLAVPEGALLTTQQGSVLVAVRDKDGGKIADFVPVIPGVRTAGYVAIQPVAGNLEEGQPIVASGVGGLILFPGAPLDPRPAKPELNKNAP